MIYIFHIFVAFSFFCVSLASAIDFKFARKVHNLPFVYFILSLTGQVLALPILLLTAGSLFFSLTGIQLSPVIALINIATMVLCTLTMWQSYLGSKVISDVIPDGHGPSLKRFLIGALFPFQLPKRGVKRIKNIPYGPAGKRNQLDIYMPKTKPNLPMAVLIHVHGGGWVIGKKHQQAKPLIEHMASNGWLVVDINYRLGPKNRMPAMIQDVLLAVAWVKANIKNYHGDANFVALTGGSAGGHLVALASLASGVESLKPGFEKTNCDVDACIPLYGIYDFIQRDKLIREGFGELQSFLSKLVMPGPPQLHGSLWEQMSPASHIRPDAPPMLILHGRHDALADFESAEAFAELLKQTSNNTVAFVALPSGQHAYDICHAPPTPEHVRAVYRFLESVRIDKCGAPR